MKIVMIGILGLVFSLFIGCSDSCNCDSHSEGGPKCHGITSGEGCYGLS